VLPRKYAEEKSEHIFVFAGRQWFNKRLEPLSLDIVTEVLASYNENKTEARCAVLVP
jgi:hypothetical protein